MQPPNNQPWQQYPQQPNTGYPSYPQYPQSGQSQQPYSSQQPPPMYMPPGPPPQRPKKRRRLVVVLAVLAVALVLCIAVSVAAANTPGTTTTITKSATGAPTSPATHASQPTTAPTINPTAKPTTAPTSNSGNVSVTHGTPLLGGPIPDFIGKFGTPNDHSTSTSFHWLRDGLSALDGLIVDEHLGTNGYTSQVDSIVAAPINGAVWDVAMASDLCTVYNPGDAHQLKRIPLVDSTGKDAGFDVVYVSASLAREFASGDFTDGNGNNVQPGSFDIQYLYKGDGTQNMDSCSLLLGQQQTHV